MNNIWDEFIKDILKQNKNDLFGIHIDIVIKYQLHKPFKIDQSLFSEIEKKLWNNYISKYKNAKLYSDKQIYNDLKEFFEIDFKNYIYQIINKKEINKLFIELTEEDYCKNPIFVLKKDYLFQPQVLQVLFYHSFEYLQKQDYPTTEINPL